MSCLYLQCYSDKIRSIVVVDLRGTMSSCKHSSFVSYRGGQQKLVDGFVSTLVDEMSNIIGNDHLGGQSVSVYKDHPDHRRVSPSAFEEVKAVHLCESACMILAFTPNYFSTSYPLCVREYRGMQQLEAERRKYTDKIPKRGLIVPVILRGSTHLPLELQKRQPFNFEDFLLADNQISSRPQFSDQVKELANYTLECYQILKDVPIMRNCEDFPLPLLDDSTRQWLDQISAPKPTLGNTDGLFPYPALASRVRGRGRKL